MRLLSVPECAAHRSNIREWYCDHAPRPNTWPLNIAPLDPFHPRRDFCQGDPHRGAVWLVGHIPPGKLRVRFDNLSMHSCVPHRMSELPHVPLRRGRHRPLPLPIRGGDDQNQGREPNDRDEAQPENGFGCSLTGRAWRGVVRTACFFVSFFGSSATMLFAGSGVAGSAWARTSASDGGGGTHGESA
jgi:hypothetical protein